MKDDKVEQICSKMPENIRTFIEECMKKENPNGYLIAVLHKVQEHFKYLPEEQLDAVSYLMQIPAARISGVASFYHYFRLKTVGKYMISVCTGTACHVKGANAIIVKIKEKLKIDFGETTEDKMFTLEGTRCIGMCAMAPVIKIGDEVFSHIKPEKVSQIIDDFIEKHKEEK